MVDPELIGEAAIEGTEASEVLMDGFVLVFLCVLAATLIMNHTLGHKLHVCRPRLVPFPPDSLLPFLFSPFIVFLVGPRWVNVLDRSLVFRPSFLAPLSHSALTPFFLETLLLYSSNT